jgi:hypothetical protein
MARRMILFDAWKNVPKPRTTPTVMEINTLRKILRAIFSRVLICPPGKITKTVRKPGMIPSIARPNMILRNREAPVVAFNTTRASSDMETMIAR